MKQPMPHILGELIGHTLTILRREDWLITDGFLSECHHIVYILGGSDPGLLALVIKPQVGPTIDQLHCPHAHKLQPQAIPHIILGWQQNVDGCLLHDKYHNNVTMWLLCIFRVTNPLSYLNGKVGSHSWQRFKVPESHKFLNKPLILSKIEPTYQYSISKCKVSPATSLNIMPPDIIAILVMQILGHFLCAQ